jgi:nucleoside-diphosphate-sugar epimerase
MDANFSVKIIVIGFTGLIGSEIYSQLTKQGYRVTGINSRVIKLEEENFVHRNRSLVEDVAEFLEEGDALVNAAWTSSERKNRNNLSNELMAISEIDLIRSLKNMDIRYLSLGSISEFKIDAITDSWDSKYAESKRSVFQYLEQNNINYVWARIASCFGSNDTRSWLINDLKHNKFKKEMKASNPNSLLNLSSVENVASNLILLLKSKLIGEVNLMSNEWYRVGEIIDAYFGGEKPLPVIRNYGPFSTTDPFSKTIEEGDFIEFLLKK